MYYSVFIANKTLIRYSIKYVAVRGTENKTHFSFITLCYENIPTSQWFTISPDKGLFPYTIQNRFMLKLKRHTILPLCASINVYIYNKTLYKIPFFTTCEHVCHLAQPDQNCPFPCPATSAAVNRDNDRGPIATSDSTRFTGGDSLGATLSPPSTIVLR